MDVKRRKFTLKKIKPSLVFFCFATLLAACESGNSVYDTKVNYTNGVATSLSFKSGYNTSEIEIFVAGETETPVLGKRIKRKSGNEFTPAIPFRPGQTYELRNGSHTLKSFTIQAVKGSIMPEVVKIYPSTDKVPENLLKIYIQFSLPMQEVGNALDFIRVTDESDGKTVDIFLRLESELWNKEHDLLTLWLDPGRIKTGLIPNMSQGLPLTAGHTYTVDILTDWKSANGQRLEEAYKKTFHVGQKDTIRPDPGNWDLQLPRADSREALELSFTENLDAILLRESLYFQDADGKDIAGFYQWDSLENSVKYVPFKNWHKGVYSLLVNSKLEDLAGNSLTRLFDEQLEEKAPVPGDTIATKRQFRIN